MWSCGVRGRVDVNRRVVMVSWKVVVTELMLMEVLVDLVKKVMLWCCEVVVVWVLELINK